MCETALPDFVRTYVNCCGSLIGLLRDLSQATRVGLVLDSYLEANQRQPQEIRLASQGKFQLCSTAF